MKLTAAECAMRDGAEGPAVAAAMDLLIRYGNALGAEKLVETRNVATTASLSNPQLREMARTKGFDAVFSEYNLDSLDTVTTPCMRVATTQLVQGLDRTNKVMTDLVPGDQEIFEKGDLFFGQRGVMLHSTCAPYLVGNVPTLGEHCAWMESSAVIYCNSVLGGRTNTEGRESTGAAALTGRIPYYGYHVPENRFGTHLIRVEVPVAGMMEWGMLGYFAGGEVLDDIPVLHGDLAHPVLDELKHFGAAAASSGGVEMYHIPGVTPEAPTLKAAFGPHATHERLVYGAEERRRTWETLNNQAHDTAVDFVMLGCPHNSVQQVFRVAMLLQGRKLSANTELWVFMPRALRDIADRSGYTDIIRAAGAHVMADTCPAISRIMPKGVKVVATDSAKQAHYLPALTGVQAWFGSVEHCVDAALTGIWKGEP